MDGSRRVVNLLGAAAFVWIAGYWIVAADGPGREVLRHARPLAAEPQVPPLAALEKDVEGTQKTGQELETTIGPAEEPGRPGPGLETGDPSESAPRVEVERPSSPPQPDVIHVVEQGDTLSRLSTRYYGSSAWADRIFEANRDILNSPHDLALGQRLRIPPKP